MPTLALLDGHSLAYRAFYALPDDLATSSGQITNAVYGFVSMLLKLLQEHHPEAVAVAWDTPVPTFRAEAYEPYKAQREKAPDTFRSQIPLIKEVLDALEVPQVGVDGFEADDVIAGLAEQAEREGWEVLVVTGDRDAFQLIDDHTKVLYTRRGISDIVEADARWVQQRYGITPDRYVDYAALRGDPSDNLPGVPGVGEKTAARLIRDFGTLEGIYEHLDELSPKLRENLEASRDQVFLNRELMQLRVDVPVRFDAETFRRTGWDRDRVRRLFESLEFRVLWDRLLGLEGGVASEVLEVEATPLRDIGHARGMLTAARVVLEPVWEEDRLFGVMVVDGDTAARFISAEMIAELGEVFAADRARFVIHDAKDLIRHFFDMGRDVRGLSFDTAIAAYLVNPGDVRLERLAETMLGIELESPDREPSGQGMLDFEGGPDLDGAAARAIAVDRLEPRLRAELAATDQTELFETIERPLVRVLARMEHEGIGVDRDYLVSLGEELRERLGELERRIHDAAGHPFNINSTQQLREVLFEELGLPTLKKTAKGAPSTDQSVLKKLAEAHPIVALLLEYRELEKLRSTYVDGYLPLIGADGRLHTRFHQMGASTGRLSSDRPNLQNIPVRSETGRTIRRAFVARPGWSFVVADYSQVELRILAHLSEDPGLLEAFTGEETDIHTATAARVFGLDPGDVTPELRRRAKAINFGLLYGMEAYGLAERLGISREEAAEHIDAYFQQFPKVQEFMQSVVSEARNRGYTETILGRRRYLPELTSDNFRVRQMGERMALNAPVQGSAADIIKKAMVDLDRVLEPVETAMLLQIHDELVVEAPPDEHEWAVATIREVMESVVDLRVPLRVDIAVGTDLAECKP